MAAGGIIVAAAAAAHRKAMESANASWGEYAKAHGLTLRPGSEAGSNMVEPRIDGKVDGVSIAFQMANVEGNWGLNVVSIPLAPLAVTIEVAPEGIMQKIGKIFGTKDLILGDAAFDPKYLIQVTDDECAKKILAAETRADMMALGVATLEYSDGVNDKSKPRILIAVARLLTTTEELDRLVAMIVRLAKVRPEPEPFR
jgi:hypothetical protein